MSIQFKGSDVSGITPDLSELEERELGINTADKKLFTNDGTNIVEIGADNVNTGLELNGTGWRLIGQLASAPIGINAMDISVGEGIGVYGARADNSITIGTDVLADGASAVVIGHGSNATTATSIAMGFGNALTGLGIDNIVVGKDNVTSTSSNILYGIGNNSVGVKSVLIGTGNVINSGTSTYGTLIGEGLLSGDNRTVIGRYNENGAGNQFEIGIGTATNARNNVFEIDSNGVALTPIVTANADIVSAGNQALVTVSFLNDSSVGGVYSVNGATGVVVLTTDNIATANDKLYISASDTAQIATNVTNISNNTIAITTKEDTITYGTDGQIFSSQTGARAWIDNTFLSQIDTPVSWGTTGQVASVNGTGDGLVFVDANTVGGLELVENMSPAMLANNPLLPDTVTQNEVYNGFEGKVNAPSYPDISKQTQVLQLTTADGTTNYTTDWASFEFGNLEDVGDVTLFENHYLKIIPDFGTPPVPFRSIDYVSTIPQADITNLTTDLGTITSAVALNTAKETYDEKPVYVSLTANATAVSYNYIYADTLTTGAFTVTLPNTPTANTFFRILDVKGHFATNNLIVQQAISAETIMGLAEDMVLNVDNKEYKLIYTGSDWRVI